MLDRQTLWKVPDQIHAVLWNGTDLDELVAWVESAPSQSWTVTPTGEEGSVLFEEPLWGDFVAKPGDVIGFVGGVFDIINVEESRHLPYPAEWIRNTL